MLKLIRKFHSFIREFLSPYKLTEMLKRNGFISEEKKGEFKESFKKFLAAYKSPKVLKKDISLSQEKKTELQEYYRTIPPKDFDTLFSLYRDYLKHEDGLINYRATWFVGVQSFLIATFGLSYQKKFEVVAQAIKNCSIGQLKGSIYLYDISLFLLVIVGIFSSYAAISSIRAAVEAIDELQRKWKEEIIQGQTLHHLPNIIGGGMKDTVKDGAELALNLPVFFLRFWTGVVFFGVADAFHDYSLLN